MADNTSTKQIQFKSSILSLLSEGTGGKLVKYLDFEPNAVGETAIFNRRGSASTGRTLDMRNSSYTGKGPNTSKVTVTLGPIYTDDWLEVNDLLKTNVDLKSAYVTSMKIALDTEIDNEIITAINANSAVTAAGDAAVELTAQYDLLVNKVAYTNSIVKDNVDHYAKTAIVMNHVEYAALWEIEKFTSSDYANKLAPGVNSIASGEIVTSDQCPAGSIYIIPAKTICGAQWKGGNDASMKMPADKDAYAIWCKTSFGATLGDGDAPAIIKFSVKPPVTP